MRIIQLAKSYNCALLKRWKGKEVKINLVKQRAKASKGQDPLWRWWKSSPEWLSVTVHHRTLNVQAQASSPRVTASSLAFPPSCQSQSNKFVSHIQIVYTDLKGGWQDLFRAFKGLYDKSQRVVAARKTRPDTRSWNSGLKKPDS